MQRVIDLFAKNNELQIITAPLDIYLEIPHLAYLEVKKPEGGKALLFTNPIDKKNNKTFDIPVLMNIFGSHRRLELIINQPLDSIPQRILSLLELKPPKNLRDFLALAKNFASLWHVFPRKRRWLSSPAQEVVLLGDEVDLYKLPVLTTWEHDGGPFITMGQIYTQSLDGSKKNLGMYRLQIFDKNHLGLHWQIHKDSQHFFHEYKQAGKKMPVSIALGGDALYTWCGQAPLPYGVYELMLYGFIRGQNPRVTRCVSNPLWVPYDADIIIEGWVNPSLMKDEGPFGDHTGFYTPIEPYPVLEVSAITHKKSPIFPASVVGKPPLEDKYMGYLTEKVFLPLLQRVSHGLSAMHMPENGVFHNLILAKITPQYPAHAKQLMHSFWGVGQMSFVKHAIFVGEGAPSLEDYEALSEYVLNRFDVENLIITQGICDALDHASPQYAYGGKLGLDATGEVRARKFELLSNQELLQRLSLLMPARKLRQFFINTSTPICVVGVEKSDRAMLDYVENLEGLLDSLAIVVFVDNAKNDLNNAYMLLWRVVNNIDAKRDVRVVGKSVFIDATDKGVVDGHLREWPKETDCSLSVLRALKEKGLLEGIDARFLHYYQIYNSPQEEVECKI